MESLFIAFRLTGDSLYRSYGWLIFQAIEKHCKVPEDKGGGFVSIRNVDREEGEKGWEDKMETFFLVRPFPYLVGDSGTDWMGGADCRPRRSSTCTFYSPMRRYFPSKVRNSSTGFTLHALSSRALRLRLRLQHRGVYF